MDGLSIERILFDTTRRIDEHGLKCFSYHRRLVNVFCSFSLSLSLSCWSVSLSLSQSYKILGNVFMLSGGRIKNFWAQDVQILNCHTMVYVPCCTPRGHRSDFTLSMKTERIHVSHVRLKEWNEIGDQLLMFRNPVGLLAQWLSCTEDWLI